MKILIACEQSQIVATAFRLRGFEAYSCDLQSYGGLHPSYHIRGDAIQEAYSGKYYMMIAHPPCTFISHAGARWLYPKGILNNERYKKGMAGVQFFTKLLNAPIKYICIENPQPSTIFGLPKHSQIIQPYQFGDEAQKKTLLWLKDLPELIPTNVVGKGEFITYPSGKRKAKWFMEAEDRGSKVSNIRSKTFPGIAEAMATQWGEYLLNKSII